MGAPRIIPTDNVIALMRPDDRKAMGVKTRDEIESGLESKAESEIQNEIEAYLRQNGFWPRSPAYLDGRRPPNGWYIHIHEAKRNPIILDLLIMTLSGRCLELELKTATGKLREHQLAILGTTDCSVLARSTGEAIDLFRQWMSDIGMETKG